MNHQPNHIYEFGHFRLDIAERMLLCDGEPIPLQPKAFDLLHVLVEHHGHLLEKDDLLKAVWPDTIVEEVNLANNVSTLRKTLGEGGNGQRFIETVPRCGYRFVAPVREQENGAEERGVAEGAQSLVVAAAREEQVVAATKQQVAPLSEPMAWGSSRWVKRRPGLAVSLVILLLIGFVGAINSWPSKRQPTAPNAAIKSIAVLPFKPLAANSRDEALELGMADTLITKLSSLRQLIVRPTSAVRNYTALDQDPLAAGQEQRVDAVLEGSLHRAGAKIRVTVRLVNVRDGTALWAYQCDEYCTDIFAAQDSISEKVARALMLELTGEQQKLLTKRYTESAAAYQLYIKGRYHWNKRTEERVKIGLQHFEQAIQLDPNYALAHAGLADSYLVLGTVYLPPNEVMPKAKAAAMRALEIDDTLAEAHTSLAWINFAYDWNWSAAESEFKRAIELNPNYATAHLWYGMYLAAMGRFDEATAATKRSQELDPLSPMNHAMAGWVFYLARQYDRAITQYRKALELEPNFFRARSTLGLVYEQKRMFGEAIAEFQRALAISPSAHHVLAMLGQAYAVSGQRGEALKTLAELREMSKQRYVSAYDVAGIYAGLGEKDQAFAWLEKAYEERHRLMVNFKVEPSLDGLRSDPRFQDLLRRIGLEPRIKPAPVL